MNNLNKVISTAKKIIDYPYNKFNLDNYNSVLGKSGYDVAWRNTDSRLPIKLMAGENSKDFTSNSGIIRTLSGKASNKKRNIYLIGKGVLFDSGGLDLKHGMGDMTGDKAGAIISIAVANYLKGNIVAFCPFTTNFIQNSLIIPGDEIKIGKKTVKITNTDAEGRLILAEAITDLASDITKDDIILTIATLTGCVGYAIGEEATGVFSPNDELVKKYLEASSEAKELAWRLPLWDIYQKKHYNKKIINNAIKDIKCGATEGAMFIKQFIPYPSQWLHLDVAYSAFGKNKKANGQPIKTLVKFIEKLNEK